MFFNDETFLYLSKWYVARSCRAEIGSNWNAENKLGDLPCDDSHEVPIGHVCV